MIQCETCLFRFDCDPHYRDCDSYVPEVEDEDAEIDEYIESERIRFRGEWFDYIDYWRDETDEFE